MKKMPHRSLLPWLVAIAACSPARAADIQVLPEISVVAGPREAAGMADSASEGRVTADQLRARPLLRPAEALESVPGLVVTQHSGDGKANQYFLRGFNLDHGSDFATFVDGVPVNNLSHAHGQGYMDLNFLIPELLEELHFRKGSYAAEDGNLAVAGSARLAYARRLPSPFVEMTVGEHDYRRFLAAGSRSIGALEVLAALELAGNDGPWEQPENLRKRNAVLRLSSGTAANGQSLTAVAYRAGWTATEHVPERAIASGEIGRYGTLAPTDGGRTHRYSLAGEWTRTGEFGGVLGSRRAGVYVVDYGLNLFSSPSGFLDGQHEQEDRRLFWGGEASQSWAFAAAGREAEAIAGIQFRQDRIGRIGLHHTVDRRRTDTLREDKVVENGLGIYGEARTQWLPWLRTTAGLRWDRHWADAAPLAGTFNGANGGGAQASRVSPKLGAVFGPFAGTEFYANWGRGFHSSDARGATSRVNVNDGAPIAPVPVLIPFTASEVGLRAFPLPGWSTTLALWRMALASELVYVGDAGVTEPRGASRRQGLEWNNHYRSGRGFVLDANLALSRARFVAPVNGGNRIPNTIPLTVSVAATQDLGGRWFGGAKLRYLGAYPLEETGSAKSTPFWTANFKVGYRFGPGLEASLEVLNLFDRKAADIEYWGSACTGREGAGCNGGNGVEGKQLHPLEPRTLRLGMKMGF